MNILYDSPQLDSILDALANQKRRGIIHDLSLQPATVGQLARRHELSLPAIHKHIRILELCGIKQRHLGSGPKLAYSIPRRMGKHPSDIRKLHFQDAGMKPGSCAL
jgi:predicted transcriptional regulator